MKKIRRKKYNKKPQKNHSKIHKEAVKTNRKELLKNIFWIVIILAFFYLSIKLIGSENLRDKVENTGAWGPFILIFIKAATVIFAPLSGTPVYLASGILFGFTKGVIYAFIGDLIGFSVSFYISRIFGKKIASYFLSKNGMNVIKDLIKHMGTTKGFIQSRLIFIGFPEAVNYAAGLTKIRFLKFISISMLIWVIPIVILVALGDTLTENLNPILLIILKIDVLIFMALGAWWFYNQAERKQKSRS